MFDFDLPQIVQDSVDHVFPFLSGMLTNVVVVWCAYQSVGLLRSLLGYKKDVKKEDE